MKLFWSSRSPFARKVMVAAHETGVASRIEIERVVVAATALNPEVMKVNPLNKIPTLVTDDGMALYDSRTICEYFDSLHYGHKLFPAEAPARWEALRRQSLGDGMMDVIVLRLGEGRRAAGTQSEPHLTGFRQKLATALDGLETEADALAADPLSIGHVAIGCALAHLDFRFADEPWRTGRPKLAAWYVGFSGRPSMRATEFVDAY